ncbi:uncharacterized protein tbc1d10c [Lycodopsis pacificus]
MLSPTSPAQKNLSEEDSSGSDAGSEVGQEPETDRFGFILKNGSTAGSAGPAPELVRQRETKWINIISQWDRILLKKTSKVKVQCQKGIPASLRAKCWPLLCGGTDKMKLKENLYQSLDSQPALQSWVDVIERDLDRQFPFHEMFLSKDGHGQRGLFRVLKAFTQYQPEEGYCQAQGPVAAVLLMNMPAEEAFWCLVQISEQFLPGYYSPLLEGVLFDAAMLNWVLKRTCPAAHKHLQHHGVEPLMFATDWLMCLFTRHLPFNTLLRVWDLFFCYGVRVLLQVAAVLVRRVLGRAEQRKQCQGQMETLERLRGVREQVQEEDDTFIAEVCSVQLSARDLEKQTEKELEKWRKDRPSSAFDPRGRCHGYRMAWTRSRQTEEERDRKEREKGNLSVPLARSASTLSLSPALLHKRWRKGGKANAREWEGGGGRVVRHLSMGAKEDWRTWADFNFKKVQRVQEEEDEVFEDHKKRSELKVAEGSEQKELLEEPKTMEIQNMPTERVEETVIVEEPTEQVETRIAEKEESQRIKTEESKELSEQKEETNVETHQTEGPTKDQSVEHKQGDEPDSNRQTHVLEQQSRKTKHLEIQGKESNKETDNQVAGSEQTEAVGENQTEIKEDADVDKNTEVETQENVYPSEEQMIQADMKPEESKELSEQKEETNVETHQTEGPTKNQSVEHKQGDEPDSNRQTHVLEQQSRKTKHLEIQGKESNKETDNQVAGSEHTEAVGENQTEIKEDADVDKNTEVETQENVYPSEEQMIQADMKPEESTETENVQQMDTVTTGTSPGSETDSKVKAQTIKDPAIETETQQQQQDVITETDRSSRGDALEGKYHSKEGTDLLADTEAEAEIPAAHDIVMESSAAFDKECEAAASEPTQEEEERSLDEHSEAQDDQTRAEETPTETSNSIAPPHEEEETDVTEAGASTLTAAGPDGKTSSVETSTSEEPAPEQPSSQVTVGAVEEESTETVQQNTVAEEDVFISTEPTDSPNTDRNPEVQDKDSHLVRDQAEPVNSGLTQAPGHRSSRSSGDFCVRKSSNSRGSRLARRLSEDVFIVSEKTNQSQSTPTHPDVKPSQLRSNPGAVKPTHAPSDGTSEVSSSPSAEVTPAVQPEQPPPDPPKRFGLFRRLRGEQPKKAPKMQIPKILIQDFSDGTGTGKPKNNPRTAAAQAGKDGT